MKDGVKLFMSYKYVINAILLLQKSLSSILRRAVEE